MEDEKINGMEYQDMIPMYVNKIDEVYDFVKNQKTAQEMPINKYANYLIMVIVIVVGLMYANVTKVNENIETVKDKIRVSESKLDFVLESFDNYKKSVKALNGMMCMQCHNTPDMMLQSLGTSFNGLEEFSAYVRTGGRQKNGMVMPPIPESVVDDYTLGRIWKMLK